MEPVFLSLDEVLEIHEQQVERYGGSPGLRDAAGLESAIDTPQATFGGKFLHATIDMVEDLASSTSDPVFRNCVRAPGRSFACASGPSLSTNR
jgi:prophage maintenance system killer protein